MDKAREVIVVVIKALLPAIICVFIAKMLLTMGFYYYLLVAISGWFGSFRGQFQRTPRHSAASLKRFFKSLRL
jgi:uncharacterized membrane protein